MSWDHKTIETRIDIMHQKIINLQQTGIIKHILYNYGGSREKKF